MKKLIFFVLLSIAATVDAQVEYGLAAQFPRDVGIADHSSVKFTENFEEPTLNDLFTRWEDKLNTANMSFTADRPSLTGGVKSLLFNGTSHLYRRLLPGYEQLYIRFYAKFDPVTCQKIHHYAWMGGHNPSTSYAWPRAGERPVGNERWSTGVEPMNESWSWDFYTYWMGMHQSGDGRYWGNDFAGEPPPNPITLGEWFSLEFMVKLNNPVTAFNGEQAFWVNGVKKQHLRPGSPIGCWVADSFFPLQPGQSCPYSGGSPVQGFEGFRWRSDSALNINYIWLENYVDTDPDCKSWVDDVVVASEYIGPMVGSPPSDSSVPARPANLSAQ